MKKYYFVIVPLLILLLIGGYLLYRSLTPNTGEQSPVKIVFPSSGVSQNTDTTVTISLQDGSAAPVKDFVHNGTTIEDPANKGTYFIQGTSGACLPNGDCPRAGTQKAFTIAYFSSEQAFGITLDEEPLGEARSLAEKYLSKTLGLTNDQMCSLRYTLGTTVYVSPAYGSLGNLKFSFCPGAVELPY